MWHVGERYTSQQIRNEFDDQAPEVLSGPVDLAGTDKASRTFPTDVYKLNEPLNTYRTHTEEQITTAYPFGPLASCGKCRATYVIDSLAMEYITGGQIANNYKEKALILPARMVYAGDANYSPDDQSELPWNIAAAMTPRDVASWSTQQNTP